MRARDIMHRDVFTVRPETPLGALARIFVEKRISAAPVVDESGALVGIVSEGDLLHRAELATDRRRSSWLRFFASIETLAHEYREAHGRTVRDVMASPVVTATPDTPLPEIVEILERRHIRRVPIVEARPGLPERLVGIVTRSDLVRALATLLPAAPEPSSPRDLTDQRIRDMLLAELGRQPWTEKGESNVTVLDGVVHLWGMVSHEAEAKALVTAAETIPGVVAVRDHTFVGTVGAEPVML
ncbi:CBS domain containing membrane protein [Methylobacterium sp. 4-46]|uniref:CBS domain-containing protein n=1 Tax=unclassified Methylobacterium TaxID=2615210 RepID=UPI000152DA4F|nr:MULTISPECIES: CBS domain-containing protein [Methylobacterium]ACA17977.1 CBS domain containing membrane protein [Methylobacterium sp. 4-46]WFT77278.1 CBS domain-containing protein [Methylobacterium nodulans]